MSRPLFLGGKILASLWLLSLAARGAEPVMRAVRDPATGQIDVTDAGRPVLRYYYQTVTPPSGTIDQVHPDYPGDYVEYPALPWFQPTFPRAGTRYELKKDQPLVLQYCLWIHGGAQTNQAEYQQQWDQYQERSPRQP